MAGVRLYLGGSPPDGARRELVQDQSLLVRLLLQAGQSGWFNLESKRDVCSCSVMDLVPDRPAARIVKAYLQRAPGSASSRCVRLRVPSMVDERPCASIGVPPSVVTRRSSIYKSIINYERGARSSRQPRD